MLRGNFYKSLLRVHQSLSRISCFVLGSEGTTGGLPLHKKRSCSQEVWGNRTSNTTPNKGNMRTVTSPAKNVWQKQIMYIINGSKRFFF